MRFRTLGCYPADRRDRERGGDGRGDRRRDAAHHHLRTPGPGDRPRCRQRQHGAEEAGGLFLMPGHRLLRFITCGSVDDGKSTLIGRLLYDSRQISDDQLAALEADSKALRHAGRANSISHCSSTALSAEREQGITIDVAYRYFSSPSSASSSSPIRPGHEQYTRNMVTGASTADARRAGGRCAQGRADADPAAQLPRAAARHPPLRAGGDQDGPGRLRPGRVRGDLRRLPRRSPTASASRTGSRSRCRG